MYNSGHLPLINGAPFIRDLMSSLTPIPLDTSEKKKVEKKIEVEPVVEPDLPDDPPKDKKL
jgi:hypothetical protein